MWEQKHVFFNDAVCYATDSDKDTGDHIDLKTTGYGEGRPIDIRAVVTTAVTGGTSIQAVLCDSADDNTFVKKLFGPVVAVAQAVAGKVLLEGPLPRGLERYLKVVFTNVGANGAGKATARLNP